MANVKSIHTVTNKIGPCMERLEIKQEQAYIRQRISTLKTTLRHLISQTIGAMHQAEATQTADLRNDLNEIYKDLIRAVKALEK